LSILKRATSLILCALSAGMISGCDKTNTPRSVDGTVVGISSEWKVVPSSEANFSILGDWSIVTGPWRNRDIQTRKQSSVDIVGGNVFYESSVHIETSKSAIRNLETIYKNDLNIETRLGVSIESGAPKSIRTSGSRIDFATWKGQTSFCIGFFVFSEASRRGYDNGEFYVGYARGARCFGNSNDSFSRAEEETLAFAGRIFLDRGAANSSRVASTPSSVTPNLSPSAAAPNASAPSGAVQSPRGAPVQSTTSEASMRDQVRANLESGQQGCISQSMADRRLTAISANQFCTCLARQKSMSFTTQELPLVLELGQGTAAQISAMAVGRFESAMTAIARVTPLAASRCSSG
jgi:hypothetical protein